VEPTAEFKRHGSAPGLFDTKHEPVQFRLCTRYHDLSIAVEVNRVNIFVLAAERRHFAVGKFQDGCHPGVKRFGRFLHKLSPFADKPEPVLIRYRARKCERRYFPERKSRQDIRIDTRFFQRRCGSEIDAVYARLCIFCPRELLDVARKTLRYRPRPYLLRCFKHSASRRAMFK
jgi:hypothetical protein